MLVSPIPESLTVVLVADARDDLDVAVRLLARRLADKREAAPIRRPQQVRRVIGGRYEQPCLPAVGGNHKDLLRPLDAGVGLCGAAVGQPAVPPAARAGRLPAPSAASEK